MRISGIAARNRPLCRIVHGFVMGNMAVLLAVQAYLQFAWGRRDPISKAWFFASVALIFLHVFAGFFWALIDGGSVQWSGDTSVSGSDTSSSSDGGWFGSDGGGSDGDGGGSGGDGGGSGGD